MYKIKNKNEWINVNEVVRIEVAMKPYMKPEDEEEYQKQKRNSPPFKAYLPRSAFLSYEEDENNRIIFFKDGSDKAISLNDAKAIAKLMRTNG